MAALCFSLKNESMQTIKRVCDTVTSCHLIYMSDTEEQYLIIKLNKDEARHKNHYKTEK